METIERFGLIMLTILLVACGKQGDKESSETDESVLLEPSIVGVEVSYATDSTNMEGFIAYDENLSGQRPGILVVHEWWGHDDYVRNRARQLAEMGYVALAVDMYGDGQQAEHPEDAGKFSAKVFSDLDEAKAKFSKAIETLKANENVDPDKIAAIGYCFGGTVILNMANAGYDLDAVVAFHSGLSFPILPDSGSVIARILVCNGADDPFVQPEQIETFKTMMQEAGADFNYIAYEGVVHSFTNPAATERGIKFELPLAYNAEADSASWREMKKLLDEVF